MNNLFLAIWQYRGFILGAVKRDFEVRYIRSVFGFLWAILEPLAMILVYTLIFSTVMRARLPGIDDSWSYSIYLCAGILTWGYFAETLTRCQTIFLDQANLLKKSNFPRSTLPIIVLLSTSLNFVIIFVILCLFLVLIERFPGTSILWMIPLLALQQGFAIGLGMLTGTLNVFFRDIGKFIGILLTFWFWTTPIVYPLVILPEKMQEIVQTWNPMAGLMGYYHAILLSESLPAVSSLYGLMILAVLMLILGYGSFLKFSNDLVDEL